jgi:23S rRNA (uracil1939-C5)-methyltransferase
MGRRRRKKIPQEPVRATVEALSHDGRGIARIDGKTTFIDNALPGEEVVFRYTWTRRKFDEGRTLEVLTPAPERVAPPCAHTDICGGCSLQHMAPAEQVRRKHETLAEQLDHFGGIQPRQWLEPLTGPVTGYRGKARLGVKYVDGRGTALVGFREKRNSFVADIHQCEVLVPELGHALMALRELINGLETRRRIPQIEVAAGDDALALVFRHMDPLPEADLGAMVAFCRQRGWHCYLQPGNEQTVHRVWPEEGAERLYYRHPDFDLELAFHPLDFTQVNAVINRAMVPRALDLLEVDSDHRVLDLFCGLGNFTLPLARRAGHVTGVELSEAMVHRGSENAARNGMDNVAFHAADLSLAPEQQPWAGEQFQRVLVDPPRSGAQEMMSWLPRWGAERVVYVSCNPATLARDAGELIRHGYCLEAAGVMDMFPHTTHVESMAVFQRR